MHTHRAMNDIGVCKNLLVPFDDIVRFTEDSFRHSRSPMPIRLHHFLPPLFIIEGTWAEVYALSDQKHENAGEPRLRPAETMKANTGNGKLAGTKERKSGHCELQRTAWKSTVDIQFGQTRGTNKKRGRRREKKGERNRRAHVLANYERVSDLQYCRKPPTSEPISTIADVTVIRRVFPDVRRA